MAVRIGILRQLILAAIVLSSACDVRGDARQSGRQTSGNIAWFHDLYEAHKVSAATGRPMLIVFGASWCHYCKEMEATTLRNPNLAAYVTANFVPVHLDADRDSRLAEIFKAKKLPCTLVLSPNADLLGRILGYQDVQPYYTELEKTRQQYFRLQHRR